MKDMHETMREVAARLLDESGSTFYKFYQLRIPTHLGGTKEGVQLVEDCFAADVPVSVIIEEHGKEIVLELMDRSITGEEAIRERINSFNKSGN